MSASRARTLVVNKSRSAYDVDITRRGIWGNPFRVGRDGDRATVIRMFEDLMRSRLRERPDLWSPELEKLRGRRLGCGCRPAACHGDVLVRLLEQVRSEVR